MKILVTGGAGFIGSHVVECYIKEGHDVILVDNLSTGKEENIPLKARFYNIDFTSEEFIALIKKEKPELVNHQAGQTLIHVAVERPKLDAKINVLGIINLLKGCIEGNVKKIIFASSAGVYGQASKMPITENTFLKPENPYAITKVVCEYYIKYFCKENDIKYTILRYGNVFGPRDAVASDHVITVFANAFLNDKQPIIHWDGNQTKDFIFVNDVAQANILSLERGANKTFNISSGEPRTINEIYNIISDYLNIAAPPVFGNKRKGDVREAYFNIAKANEQLLWKPKNSFNIDLKRTLDWYKIFFNDN